MYDAVQAEKRKLLMEQETQKIKELDEQYNNELREWKANLIPRKQVNFLLQCCFIFLGTLCNLDDFVLYVFGIKHMMHCSNLSMKYNYLLKQSTLDFMPVSRNWKKNSTARGRNRKNFMGRQH